MNYRKIFSICFLLSTIVLVLTLSSPSIAQLASPTMQEIFDSEPSERKFYAFITGAAEYPNFDDNFNLPAVKNDLSRMRNVLEGMNYEVNSVASQHFNDIPSFLSNFRKFIQPLNEGDIFLFYFSGHGFSLDGNNFLVSSQFSDDVKKSNLTNFALPLPFVVELLQTKKPGTIYLIVDACRTEIFLPSNGVQIRTNPLQYEGLETLRKKIKYSKDEYNYDAWSVTYSLFPTSYDSNAATPISAVNGQLSPFTDAISIFLETEKSNNDLALVELSQQLKNYNKGRHFFDDRKKIGLNYRAAQLALNIANPAEISARPSFIITDPAPVVANSKNWEEDTSAWHEAVKLYKTLNNCNFHTRFYLENYPWGRFVGRAKSLLEYGPIDCKPETNFTNFVDIHESHLKNQPELIVSVPRRQIPHSLPSILSEKVTEKLIQQFSNAPLYASARTALEANRRMQENVSLFEQKFRKSYDISVLERAGVGVTTGNTITYDGYGSDNGSDAGELDPGVKYIIPNLAPAFQNDLDDILASQSSAENAPRFSERFQIQLDGFPKAKIIIKSENDNRNSDGVLGKSILEFDWDFAEVPLEDILKKYIIPLLEDENRTIQYISTALPAFPNDGYRSLLTNSAYSKLLQAFRREFKIGSSRVSAITSNKYQEKNGAINIRIFGS